MADIYKETEIVISLNTGQDMSSATGLEIHYEKPDGSTGEWSGTANGNNIEYEASLSDIDTAGTWKFQSVATIATKTVKGSIAKQEILEPIKTT